MGTTSSSLRSIKAMQFREYSRDRTEVGFHLIPRQGYAHSFSKHKVIKDNTNDSITWYLVTLWQSRPWCPFANTAGILTPPIVYFFPRASSLACKSATTLTHVSLSFSDGQ